tara:strand:+ start:259 stop:678 length:420 start_codon:yes stop_codon:yes gene_type:complete
MEIERTNRRESYGCLEETYLPSYSSDGSNESRTLEGIGYFRTIQADGTPFEVLNIETAKGCFQIKKSQPFELRGCFKKLLVKHTPKLAKYFGIKEDKGYEVIPNTETAKQTLNSLDDLTQKAILELPEYVAGMIGLISQ